MQTPKVKVRMRPPFEILTQAIPGFPLWLSELNRRAKGSSAMHRRTPRCSCQTVGLSSTSTTAPRARVTLVPSPSPALRPWNGCPSCCFDEPLVVAQVGGPFPSSSVRSVHSLGMRFVAAADGQLLGVPTIAATPTHVAPGVSTDASCATSSRPLHRSPTPPAARHSSADDKWEDCSPRGPATSATATTGSCCCVSV
jgi:hypothetical protein